MTAKKTSTKKAAKKTPAKAPAKKPAAECSKGGAHDWQKGDDGTTLCTKCFEPASTSGKAKAKRSGPKPKATAKAKGNEKPKKLSALDAAAKVLTESKEPLNTREMIEAMAAKGYWASPNGQTPHATLYSAIHREISAKEKDARFKKTERGHFAFNG